MFICLKERTYQLVYWHVMCDASDVMNMIEKRESQLSNAPLNTDLRPLRYRDIPLNRLKVAYVPVAMLISISSP